MKLICMSVLVALLAVGCAKGPKEAVISKVQSASEALDRKKRSEALLRSENVPVNEHLPYIESEKEAKTRTKEEIAYRAMSLLVVAAKGEGLEQSMVDTIVKDYGLEKHFSPAEQKFLSNKSPSENDRTQFTWRYEAAWVLLWSLGYVEQLTKPSSVCDVPQAVSFMKDRTAAEFIAQSKLRPMSEILDEADRIYRYHWAVVDARLKKATAPAGLNPDVTQERHYALNWLIGYMDQEWDDVSTDT